MCVCFTSRSPHLKPNMALPLSHGVPSCHISHTLQNSGQKFASLLALQCFWMSEPASALFRDQSNCCEFKPNIFHLKCHGRSAKQKRIVGNRLETTAGWSVYSSINSSVLMNWVWKLPLYWWRHGWSTEMRKIVIASSCRQNLESVYLSLGIERFFWRGQ